MSVLPPRSVSIHDYRELRGERDVLEERVAELESELEDVRAELSRPAPSERMPRELVERIQDAADDCDEVAPDCELSILLRDILAWHDGQHSGWMPVVDEIASERRRQVEAEGWVPDHDDEHYDGSLAIAAACYAMTSVDGKQDVPGCWPWDAKHWKPKDPRRDLIRAAALIVAEIERIDRFEASLQPAPEKP